MWVSASARRAEPIPRREQDGDTYSPATRSRSTSNQPIVVPSTATHTSWSRIARAMRSAAARVAHFSACSIEIAGTASARMALRRVLASVSASAASARRICISRLFDKLLGILHDCHPSAASSCRNCSTATSSLRSAAEGCSRRARFGNGAGGSGAVRPWR